MVPKENRTGYKPQFDETTPISALLARNAAWASRQAEENPGMLESLAHSQSPKILWIGCSDSRVPETTILDLLPGDLFVHRNIANVVSAGDLSVLSVLQFAVEVLKVKHIIVCGHTDCGGCKASLTDHKLGLIDNWLRHIRDVRALNAEQLDKLPAQKRLTRLVELNVVQQVHSTMRVPTVQEAMKERGLQVHGLVYEVESGRLREVMMDTDHKFDCYTINGH